ncbi:MAG TPA: biotin--[acetyl-CoA-carboxylase] ligase [Steroidobacteraceae bacterium]|nr:biotin--[acetyl-CoA-carboxylase] ligase [Steroidobacteraceae bacterium]
MRPMAHDEPGEATVPTLAQRVFAALADGAVHSGEQLAAEQRVSRTAIWKAVGALQELGVAIEATPNRGYRMTRPVTPLHAGAISAGLEPEVRARLRHGDVAWTLASTNSTLLSRGAGPLPGAAAQLPAGQFDFLAAEYQSAGRGRNARRWFAPPGGALCLSLAWSFAALPRHAAALSLAVGVCARRALAGLAPSEVRLKWPNDLLVGERKLGGILIELRAESGGPAYVVIGVGINCALGDAVSEQVRGTGSEAIDLAALGVAHCDRNRLAAGLLGHIVRGVQEFERAGLQPFAAEWAAADALAGRVVSVALADGAFIGHARGIDADGALCVHGNGALRRFNSGEVSVRASP